MVKLTLTSHAAIVLGKIFIESKIDGDNMLAARDARRKLQGPKKAFDVVSKVGLMSIQCPFGKESLGEDEAAPTATFLLENASFKFLEERFRAVKAIKDEKDPRGLPTDLAEGACDLEEAFSKAEKDVEKKKD